MKVSLGTIDVDDRDRYVVAKYFAAVDDSDRTRATRKQVRAFAKDAFRTHVSEQAGALKRRERNVAARLSEGKPVEHGLREPAEKQLSLFMMIGGQ